MKSQVYFIDFRATPKENFLEKLGRLLKTAGLFQITAPKDLVAIKLHFGEPGNTAFIRPVFIRKIVESVKAAKGTPFLTDANTLYAGSRGDSVNHLRAAVQNGFSYSVVEAPLVIADGLRGQNETAINISQKHFKTVYAASDIMESDVLISVAHFKGHELSGFGGALKNVGMGCASRKGKLAQHSNISPKIKRKKCVGCGDCANYCAHGAISMKEKKAAIDPNKCAGCSQCIIACPNQAVQIRWNQSIPIFQENMVEYCFGILEAKKSKTLFINFITDVSPNCDCISHNDAPIVGNIGVAASADPVALDQASVDMVNNETALAGSCVTKNAEAGRDKFKEIYPEVDWQIQLKYAEKLGLGSRKYELLKI